MTNNTGCTVTYFIDQKTTGAETLSSAPWNSLVSFDGATLSINHVGLYLETLNHSISIYIRAESIGQQAAYKQIEVNFLYPEVVGEVTETVTEPDSEEIVEPVEEEAVVNEAPTFSSNLTT